MSRITILELFPLYFSARKWGMSTEKEIVRLEKEFTIVKKSKQHHLLYFEIKEVMYVDNQLHNFSEPSIANIYLLGNKHIGIGLQWYKCDKLDRKNNPAVMYFDVDENTFIELEWYKNGKLHNTSGPARLDLEFNQEQWFTNGKLHRVGKPAIINYKNDNSIISQIWYTHGKYENEIIY